jgi:ACT domain-containing protein
MGNLSLSRVETSRVAYLWPKYIDAAFNYEDVHEKSKLEIPLTVDDMGPISNQTQFKDLVFEIDYF